MPTHADPSRGEIPSKKPDKIRCDACPVMCYIAEGRAGACDRYANLNGRITRTDPLTLIDSRLAQGETLVPFAARDWDGSDPVIRF